MMYFILYKMPFQPEILHFCLCAEHVLMDDTGSCRLTGFDFKDHVLQREMEEEEDGVRYLHLQYFSVIYN